ncbi:GNAT family N-acetyltransferase [Emticicia sp. C21]|uniref:GNAT family N-acetyltransferase n=1 Tax=Emticicia sp. C21 TaxID=2302915 RepID=UPI000E352965|nr:GNAT family N-acetyltransferase [Emticicia sp. C21]RFS18512.1 GNAT family N-acetyltransferase [Emticicia sp. C21]
MQGYIFRKATIDDIEKLKLIGLNSFGNFKDQLTEDNWEKLKNYLTGENTYPELLNQSTCFVCEHANEVIGMAFLFSRGNPTDIFQEDWSYLRMVGVNAAYAGKGLGRRLIEVCIDHARTTGEKTIALHTSEFMDAARHLYEDMGFNQVRELPSRLGKKYWLYRLEL